MKVNAHSGYAILIRPICTVGIATMCASIAGLNSGIHDEMQTDRSVKTLRKYQAVGPSKGVGALSKKQAEVERDKFLLKLNAATVEVASVQIATTGVALFSEVAKMYEEGYLGRENHISKPTREKETFYLSKYIVPKWGALRLNQIQSKAVEDWLHVTFESWWTMHGVRAIMSRVFYYGEGHGLWEEGKRSPASKAKLGKKKHKYERRILSFDETARVLARLHDPIGLVIEVCIATGARISEVLGLTWKHVNLDAGTIKIVQRVWHQDVGKPKSEDSKRVLGIGDLVERLRTKATTESGPPGLRVPAKTCSRKAPLGLWCSRCFAPSGGSRRMRFPRTWAAFVSKGEHYLAAASGRQRDRGLEDRWPQ